MSQIATSPLDGLRVLVAEDNFFVAEFIRQILFDLACTVIGPANNLDETLRAIRTNEIDGALLDVQLGEVNIFPAANELALRGIPFILTTGDKNVTGLPELLVNAPLLVKPFDVRRLEDMVRNTFRARVRSR